MACHAQNSLKIPKSDPCVPITLVTIKDLQAIDLWKAMVNNFINEFLWSLQFIRGEEPLMIFSVELRNEWKIWKRGDNVIQSKTNLFCDIFNNLFNVACRNENSVEPAFLNEQKPVKVKYRIRKTLAKKGKQELWVSN